MTGIVNFSLAQTDTLSKKNCKNDSTKMNFGSVDVIVIKKYECNNVSDSIIHDDKNKKPKKTTFSNWPGIYLGVNGLLTPAGSTDLGIKNRFLELDYSKSVTWGINFADVKFKIVPDYVTLTTGLGIQWNKYGLKNNYSLYYNADSVYGIQDSLVKFTKNKLNATYLQIPLLFEFRTNAKARKAFHFAFGVIGGYKLGSNLKQEYSFNGFDSEGKTKGHYQLNPFQAYGTFRMGYGKRFTVFANYGLTPVFEKGKGPDLRPFTVGLYLPI